MKNLLLLFLFLLPAGIILAQDNDLDAKEPLISLSPELLAALNKFSVTITIGTQLYNPDEFGKIGLKDLNNISLNEITISYKLNERYSFGLGTLAQLGNPLSGYFNEENEFFPFCLDDDGPDDMEGEDDDMEDEDDEECDEIGDNLMGLFTMQLSDKLPFFLQAAAGYSFSANAPAYALMAGYNQRLFAGFGLKAGFRFSDILYKKPSGAISTSSSTGLRADLGISWNF